MNHLEGQRGIAIPLILLALVLALSLLPPETRGESMAGCAALAVLLALVVTRPGPRPATAGMVALAVVAAWPLTVAAGSPGRAVLPLAVLLLGAVLGTTVASLPRAARGGRILACGLAIAGSLLAAHAVYDRIWGLARKAALVEAAGDIPDRIAVLARLGGGRSFEPFATPAALGGFLALCLPVTAALAWGARGGRRVIWGAMAAMQLAGILATASATAIASLLGVVLVAGLLHRSTRRWMLAAAATTAVVLVAVVVMRGGEILDPEDPDHPVRLRAGNFRIAAEMAGDHPWLGVGPGNFGEAYPSYRAPGDNESQHAHNLPLEWSAEYGILQGGVMSVLFLVVFLAPLFRFGRRGGDPPWRFGIAVGLAAFAVHNLADFTAFFPSMLWLAAIFRGVVAEEECPAPVGGPGLAGRIAVLAVTAGTVVAALVAAGSGLAWNARKAAESAVATGEYEVARQLAARSVRLAPWDVDARLVHAGTLLQGAAPGADPSLALLPALEEVEAALRLSPVRPNALAQRAAIRERTGDVAGAYADYIHASRLYPLRRDYVENAERIGGLLAAAAAGEAP